MKIGFPTWHGTDRRSLLKRLAVLLAAVLTYLFSFLLLQDLFGDIAAAVALIPVGLAGWLLGTTAGVILGLALFPANILLLSMDPHPWNHVQFAVGSVLIIGTGAGVGRISELASKWKDELAERDKTRRDLERRNRELAIFSAIAQALGQSLKINEILEVVLKKTLDILDITRGAIYLVSDDAKTVEMAVYVGIDQKTADALRILPMGTSIVGGVAVSGASRAVNDVVEESGAVYKAALGAAGIRSAIFVPLKAKGKTVGVFTASSIDTRHFTPEETSLIEAIGGQIGSAIETARLFEKMNYLSLTDELTGLYNRRHFKQVLEAETLRSMREGRSFSLVMIDLDSFKAHNDKYGHQSGDELLKAFANVLKSEPRKTDTAFRLGGDEFSIVLPGASAEVTSIVLSRITSAWRLIQLPGMQDACPVSGFSVGVAAFPIDSDTSHGLIGVADAELYRAKSETKQRNPMPPATPPPSVNNPTPVREL